MRQHALPTLLRCAFAGVLFLSPAACLYAAPGDDLFDVPLERLEEIVVVVRKRREFIQEVPIAVTVFNRRALQLFGFDHIIDVADFVPNLNISTPFAASNPFISLRGIGNGGDFNPNIDSGVGVHIDDVFLQAPAARLGQMFDLEQVEVLRGPQGTLYGKNTTGGAINMFSRKPSETFEADVKFSGGNYGFAHVSGGVSLPIIEDRLAARVAFSSNDRDGTARNLFDGDHVNDVDNRAARATFVYRAPRDLTATLTLHAFENRSQQRVGKGQVLLDANGDIVRRPDGQIDLSAAVQDAFGFNGFAEDPDPHHVHVNDEGYEDVDTRGLSLTVVKDWQRYSLTSVTGYNDIERDLFIDFDFSPNRLGENRYHDRADYFSQEIRLTYDNEDDLTVLGGLYYFDGTTESDARFGWFDSIYPRLQHKQDTKSYAAFSQFTLQLTDKLTLTPGARYTYEEKSLWIRSDFLREQLVPRSFSNEIGVGSMPVIPPTRDEASWGEVSGKVTLEYQLQEDLLTYLSFSRGFKSGGYRLPTTRADLAGSTVDPEVLNAWELGVKSSWFERRLRANLGVFLYDYKDLHVFSLNSSAIGADFVVNNATAATLYGLELELQANPTEFLQFQLNVGWLPEAEYDEFVFDPTGPAPQDLAGARMQFTPEYDVSAVLQYTRPVWANNAIRARLEWERQASSFSSPFELDRLEVDAYYTANASLALALGDNYEIELWVRNLTDEDHRTLYVDIEGFGFDMVNFTDPRTWGLSLTARF